MSDRLEIPEVDSRWVDPSGDVLIVQGYDFGQGRVVYRWGGHIEGTFYSMLKQQFYDAVTPQSPPPPPPIEKISIGAVDLMSHDGVNLALATRIAGKVNEIIERINP